MTVKFKPVARVVSALAIILVGLPMAVWAMQSGHFFGGFVALAAMFGALVPLYPDEDS